MTRRRAVPIAAAAAVIGSLVAGCGSSSAPKLPPPLATAPEPAVSPPVTAQAAGSVVAFAGAPEGVAVTADGTVAVNVRQPDGLKVFPIASDGRDPRFIPLGGSARHLTLGGPDGPALVADESDDQFVRVALPGGDVLSSTKVGRQPHEAFATGPDSYWVADELANTYHLVTGAKVTRVVPAPLQPGGGAAATDGRHVVGVGVRGRQIWEYTTTGDLVGKAACGAGPTHVITGSGGLFWVNDTNGGEILGFKLGAHGPEQVARIATGAGSRPYGIAYDPTRKTLWTTLTGRNQLLGLTFSGTKVTKRQTFATVRQPNTVAVDEATDQLVVTGSTSPGQLQVLTP